MSIFSLQPWHKYIQHQRIVVISAGPQALCVDNE